ncbi:hypothetical protein GCM10010983_30180 [Caulobacter rhizosphaerae]|nr:hypothetical protein GCM10010983_30180 [Caulobacter rhizosphaerae]
MMMQALAAAIFNAEPHELLELIDLGGSPLVEALAYPYGKLAFLTSIVIPLLPDSTGRDALKYHRHLITNAVSAASSEDRQLLGQALKDSEFSAEDVLAGLEWLGALVANG